jgi:pyruvate dehydrogenase E1 component alpha subunit
MKLAYRTEEEIEHWRARDPLEHAGAKIEAAVRSQIDAEVEALLDDAIVFARRSRRPERSEAFDFVYATGLKPRRGVAS